MLQIAGFLDNSTVNGKGLRSVLFVSGCKHDCNGCHNKEMQNFHYGDKIELQPLIDRIKHNVPLISGVTFSGGEPFEQSKELASLAKQIKKENLNLWCYTGYTFEDLLKSQDENKINLLKQIDVLIDGKFDKSLCTNAPKYAGSKNQRLIDVKRSLESGSIVFLEL